MSDSARVVVVAWAHKLLDHFSSTVLPNLYDVPLFYITKFVPARIATPRTRRIFRFLGVATIITESLLICYIFSVASSHLLLVYWSLRLFFAGLLSWPFTPYPRAIISWHKNRHILAVIDESRTRIYIVDVLRAKRDFSASATNIVDPTATDSSKHELPLLMRHGKIFCAEWQPNSKMCLAIGTSNGTYIYRKEETWTLEQYLRGKNVQCLSWHPLGLVLAIGSSSSNSVTLWDVASETRYHVYAVRPLSIDHFYLFSNWPLAKRAQQESLPALVALSTIPSPSFRWWTGVTSVKWCHEGHHLMVGTISNLIVVFEIKNWTRRKYAPYGPPSHTFWSPDNDLFLFASGAKYGIQYASSQIYMLSVQPIISRAYWNDRLSVSFDVKKNILDAIALDDRWEDHRDIAAFKASEGKVFELAWDNSGQRMAVSFFNFPAVAIFDVLWKPIVSAKFLEFISHPTSPAATSPPLCMAFAEQDDHGATLAVLWATDQLSFRTFSYNRIVFN